MKNESSEGCPRCDDYDKIKDELENNKRKSQDEQKNSLKRCEESKVKLQKKLLIIGVIAVVAGTILGKEFVDKIADYIDSFNDVKNGASKLIGQANPPIAAPTQVTKEDTTEEEIDDAFVLVPAPISRDLGYWPSNVFTMNDTSLSNMTSGIGNWDLLDVITESTLDMRGWTDDYIMESMDYSSLMFDFTTFGTLMPEVTHDDFSTFVPYMEQQPIYLPSTSTLSVLCFPFFTRSRKRNTI